MAGPLREILEVKETPTGQMLRYSHNGMEMQHFVEARRFGPTEKLLDGQPAGNHRSDAHEVLLNPEGAANGRDAAMSTVTIVAEEAQEEINRLRAVIAKLENVKELAQTVADGMKATVGGAWYQFTGSMDQVDQLRAALDDLRHGPAIGAGKGASK
jgi:hypothetical protein